jgi:hypothetical protein
VVPAEGCIPLTADWHCSSVPTRQGGKRECVLGFFAALLLLPGAPAHTGGGSQLPNPAVTRMICPREIVLIACEARG